MDRASLETFGAQLRDAYEDAKKRSEERRHRLAENRAFHRGMQHGHVDREGRWVPLIPRDPRITFETVPVIGQAVAVAVERRLAAWPSFDVRAPVPGVVANAQARTMEAMAREIVSWREDFYYENVVADYAAEIDGACLGKTYWDPFAGPPLPNAQEGDSPFQGDWVFEAVSLDDALIDPTATSFRRARCVWHRKVFARLEAEQRWPVDIFGETTKGRFETLDAKRRASFELDVAFSGDTFNEIVEITEHWYRPTVDFPNGLLVVMSGSMIIAIPTDATGAPTLPDGIFPWRMNYGANIVPFSLVPDGGVARLISLQKSLNHTHSRMRQAAGWASAPFVAVPEQSEIKQKSFSDVGGDVVRFRAPYKPEIIVGPGISAGHLSHAQLIRAGINDVSGQTDESRGLVNSANATGARIRTADTLNARLHGSTLVLKGYFLAGVMQDIFAIIARRYTPGRFVALRGRNSHAKVVAFTEGMINPECRFLFDAANIAPKNRESEIAAAREDFAAGVFDDTPAAMRFRRAVNLYQEASDSMDPDAVHFERAQEEDVAFLLAARRDEIAQSNVEFGDDNDIHLDVHGLTMLEPEFLALPDQIKQAYHAHVIAHQQLRAQKLQEQLAEQAAMGPPAPTQQLRGSPPAQRGNPGRPGGSNGA